MPGSLDEHQQPEQDRGTYATHPSVVAGLGDPDFGVREQAWRRFEQIYSPMLYAWASSLGHQGQDADDLVQEVKSHILAQSRTFTYDPKKRFRGLLKVVLTLKGAELSRARKRANPGPLPEVPAREFDLEREWKLEMLRLAIEDVRQEYHANPQRSPVTFRSFEMRVLEGKRSEQVALELGISRDAVDKNKSRVTAEVALVIKRLEDELG
jgi:RNA polymerase sigma-70 factor (ECF subfamily)